MRFATIAAGIALLATAQAVEMSSKSGATQITDDGIIVATEKCMDGYFDCITSCPFIIPDCSTWGLNCAIIYC
ncbi:hypothetical protein FQN54_004804 [Arachnomyces sp. PD_36]|nr:hypothetical protein FQN54_004804 [Arachnomyces sp. PD_36]